MSVTDGRRLKADEPGLDRVISLRLTDGLASALGLRAAREDRGRGELAREGLALFLRDEMDELGYQHELPYLVADDDD